MMQIKSLTSPGTVLQVSVKPRVGPPVLIELVPGNRWGVNLRAILTKATWDRLRTRCYATAGHFCEICGGVGRRHPVEAHEVWLWDEVAKVQKLERLIALCPNCHEVKHAGRAVALGNVSRVLSHMVQVNGWTAVQARAHLDASMIEWRRKSGIDWTIDLSWLQGQGVPVPQADP